MVRQLVSPWRVASRPPAVDGRRFGARCVALMQGLLADLGQRVPRRKAILKDPAQDAGHIGVSGTDRIGEIIDGRRRGLHLNVPRNKARSVGAEGQDEQHRVTIRPAIGKRRLKRSIRIKPGQILVTEFEDIDMAHHPAQARDICVGVADETGPDIGVQRRHDAASLAVPEELFPGIGVLAVNQSERADMEQPRFLRHVTMQIRFRHLPFRRAVAMECIGRDAVADRHDGKRGWLRHPRRGQRHPAFLKAFGKKLAKRILGNRCQIGNLLALPSRRHGNIEGRPARIGDILRQTVGRRITGHQIDKVLATDGNHIKPLQRPRLLGVRRHTPSGYAQEVIACRR